MIRDTFKLRFKYISLLLSSYFRTVIRNDRLLYIEIYFLFQQITLFLIRPILFETTGSLNSQEAATCFCLHKVIGWFTDQLRLGVLSLADTEAIIYAFEGLEVFVCQLFHCDIVRGTFLLT